jgi:hypothetical protein
VVPVVRWFVGNWRGNGELARWASGKPLSKEFGVTVSLSGLCDTLSYPANLGTT